MFVLHVKLHSLKLTRLVYGVLTVEGGSGLSQVGGMPALRGVAGSTRRMMVANLIFII